MRAPHLPTPLLPLFAALLGLVGCAPTEPEVEPTWTWHRDARPIVERHCTECHGPGGIGPFPLDSYAEIEDRVDAVAAAVRDLQMPVWPADRTCNDYSNDVSLNDEERAALLGWIEEGAHEGDEADYVAPEESEPVTYQLSIPMDEGYTPSATNPDDYRCFVLEWPAEEERFVTGFRVAAGQPELVHHVIAYAAQPSTVSGFRAQDEAWEGPGYPCYGGPFATAQDENLLDWASVNWLGAWAPGPSSNELPPDTGLRVRPGSAIILQIHYNTLELAPAEDLSAVEFQLADEVRYPSMVIPFTDIDWVSNSDPMEIPAGDPSVVHSNEDDLSTWFSFLNGDDIGLTRGEPFLLHLAALHMHTLGRRGTIDVIRGDGTRDCQLHIDDWDFNWQQYFNLSQATRIDPAAGDRVEVSCEWDNSEANQPVVDGTRLPARDVVWGDGTRDEMCLALLYVSAP